MFAAQTNNFPFQNVHVVFDIMKIPQFHIDELSFRACFETDTEYKFNSCTAFRFPQ